MGGFGGFSRVGGCFTPRGEGAHESDFGLAPQDLTNDTCNCPALKKYHAPGWTKRKICDPFQPGDLTPMCKATPMTLPEKIMSKHKDIMSRGCPQFCKIEKL